MGNKIAAAIVQRQKTIAIGGTSVANARPTTELPAQNKTAKDNNT